MSAKQTGPGRTVKGLALILVAAQALFALAGCAGGWTNPDKSAAEMRADENACNKDSEEDALQRSGRQRSDYGAPPSGPTAGNLGPSPMAMKDRDATTQDFRSSYDQCMGSKGYTRGASAKN